MQDTNIRVNGEVHHKLVIHLEKGDRKIGKFVEAAILEKIEREKQLKKDKK